jgi:hypothetical protein
MFDPILLAALLTTVLLGGALFRVLRSEWRRANLEPLLSTIAMTARSADVQVFSLRRSGLQRNALPTRHLSTNIVTPSPKRTDDLPSDPSRKARELFNLGLVHPWNMAWRAPI